MNELLGRFQEEFGLTSERLLEVVCEAVLLCEKEAKKRIEEAFMKRPPMTLESELEWHREVSRRALAEKLRALYLKEYAEHASITLRRQALSFAKEVLGSRLPPSLRYKGSCCLTKEDVVAIFSVLGVKSRLVEALQD